MPIGDVVISCKAPEMIYTKDIVSESPSNTPAEPPISTDALTSDSGATQPLPIVWILLPVFGIVLAGGAVGGILLGRRKRQLGEGV